MINVLSMKSVSNVDVTGYYMETIFVACSKVTQTRWFTWDKLPEKKDLIIVSTVVEALKLYLKGYSNIGVWIQGILPEESYLKHKSKFRTLVLSTIEKIVLKKACIVFVVTEEMILHYKNKYGLDISDKSLIMPCFNTLLDNDSFSNKERYNNNVFCYAGSLAPWQCFDEILQLYKKVEQVLDGCELRVFTRDTEKASEKCKRNIKNYQIKSCTNEELQKELKNTTYGFIVRDDIEVNRVATPTKISSYLGNGVIPIYTDSLRGFSTAAKGKSCVCRIDSIEDSNSIINYCIQVKDVAQIEKDIRSLYSDYFNREKYIAEISTAIRKIQ